MTDDPLHTALTEALRPHGITNPAAIHAAAHAAIQILGRDRCTHYRATHDDHHHTPVDGCPWRTTHSPGDRHPQPAATTIPTGNHL
ncbi:hypothetical protein [Streptomyces naphthomycinicus]|uniref:hypothetical protein n=1 Tax=Streptomyces naphthomycinicus TaxID=2872625 RepID=UPI001CEC2D20|nr:hypothetical protein [Streptomyces sp. TML10]